MQQIVLTLDLLSLQPHQMAALLELVESLQQPYVIPTSDEHAEHDKLCTGCEIVEGFHAYDCPMAQD
jgi:hypothetical protein